MSPHFFFHVVCIGKVLINLNKWEQYQDEFIGQADKIIVVTKEAKEIILKQNLKPEDDIIVFVTGNEKSLKMISICGGYFQS